MNCVLKIMSNIKIIRSVAHYHIRYIYQVLNMLNNSLSAIPYPVDIIDT